MQYRKRSFNYVLLLIFLCYCTYFTESYSYLHNITKNNLVWCVSQYPQDKTKDVKMPVELRINIWLGLSAVEKKFNSFAEGTFSVFAEMVCPSLLSYIKLGYELLESSEIVALLKLFCMLGRKGE